MKIAVLIPCHGDPKFDFLMSYGGLLLRSGPFHEMLPFGAEGSNLPGNRNALARLALGWGADWLFWLDVDHTFPADTLERLLAHGKAAIGVNQPMRGGEGKIIPMVTGLDGTRTAPERGKPPEEVASVGMSMTLIRAEAMRKVKFPFFAGGNEDGFFCKRPRESGTPIFIDHDLSIDCGHIAETVLRFPG